MAVSGALRYSSLWPIVVAESSHSSDHAGLPGFPHCRPSQAGDARPVFRDCTVPWPMANHLIKPPPILGLALKQLVSMVNNRAQDCQARRMGGTPPII